MFSYQLVHFNWSNQLKANDFSNFYVFSSTLDSEHHYFSQNGVFTGLDKMYPPEQHYINFF